MFVKADRKELRGTMSQKKKKKRNDKHYKLFFFRYEIKKIKEM